MKYRVYDISIGQIKDPMHAPLDECNAPEIEAADFSAAARAWVATQRFTENSNYEVGTLLLVNSEGARARREFIFQLQPEITILANTRPLVPSRHARVR